ncbi:MAG TPA: hypothetical protein VEU32_12865 [Burkholderiales bacterium]|nr:hypothetical protein [Burkholderiales bacterium]
MRYALLVVLLASAPCVAQDLPDPGRRLSKEEQSGKNERGKEPKPTGPFDPVAPPKRNDRACEGARQNYQMSCRTQISPMANSQACAEAYAIYRQACP